MASLKAWHLVSEKQAKQVIWLHGITAMSFTELRNIVREATNFVNAYCILKRMIPEIRFPESGPGSII
ncbi:MAG TPA: hypothetical protein VKA95_01800 [Nitrososphaeraceae archaeon]|nr:hypothetical protein [Nitrososphaeraceae archaeon]